MLAQGGEQLLAESITVSNFKNTVSKLVKRYVAEFIDSFNQYIKLIYIFYLKRILIARNVKRFKPKKIVSGKIGEIKTIKKTENVIYVSTIQSLYDYIFILLMISHFKLPFPRFFVNKSAVKSKIQRFFIKRTGGFIVDPEKLSNIIYKEALNKYISTMIEHGVPILYFPELNPTYKDNDDISEDFFNLLSNSMLTHTIEIVLIPIEISFKYLNDITSFDKREKIEAPRINFSKPFYLSDYTKADHSEKSISEIVKSIWETDLNNTSI